MLKPTKAIAYVRVSTTDQADNGQSLEAQQERIRAYATLYGIEIVAWAEDAGVSAKNLDRPGMRQALRALEAGEAEALIVAKLDRLTRSVRDLDALIDRYFSDGFQLLSVSEQIDTRSAAGRLVLNVLTAVAAWEREAIGERTSAAMRSMSARGRYVGGVPPYGYRVGADGELAPDPEEQEAIQALRRVRAAGLSYRACAQALAEDGYRSRTGRVFLPRQLRRMLDVDKARVFRAN